MIRPILQNSARNLTLSAPLTEHRGKLLCLFFLAIITVHPAAQATFLPVSSTNDSGPGSLRQVIADANAGDTVLLTLPSAITLTSGEIVIDKDLIINGSGPEFISVSGNNTSRVFNVTSGTITILGLTIANGSTISSVVSNAPGGGIFNAGTLVLSNCHFTGNSAASSDGTGGDGGGIYNLGSLMASHCVFSNNSALYLGGGIYNGGNATFGFCTLSGNSATNAAGGGIWNENNNLTVSNSVLAGNSAAGGGGIANKNGTVMLSSSTLSANRSELIVTPQPGGGIYNGYFNETGGTLAISNCTLHGNSGSIGGGLFVSVGNVAARNTILAGNTASQESPDCSCTNLVSQDFNLIQDTNGCVLVGATLHNVIDQDPLLGPLAHNGGPTATHALLFGSRAIDAGHSGGETNDQRGELRPVDLVIVPNAADSDGSDIGAFEAATLTAPPTISQGAYDLLNQRTAENRAGFFVYQDADSGFNHGFPTGKFPAESADKIHVEPACIDDLLSPDGCSSDPNVLDRVRKNVLRITFDPLSPSEFVGLNIQEPECWDPLGPSVGYDLRGATQVVFEVRTPSLDGIEVQFGVGGSTNAFQLISTTWTTVSIPLDTLDPPLTDPADVHILFSIATDYLHATNGGIVLLDNIHFEPVPSNYTGALSFPLSTETFGAQVVKDGQPGEVTIPPDQSLRNLTTIYESALTLYALLQRRTVEDLVNARAIADTFHYAFAHESQGVPLPPSGDDSTGLHSGYESGDVALFNDQACTGQAGKASDVRLAGFTSSMNLCGPSGFCLVLDGATGGNNAFAILALAEAYNRFQDTNYLNDIRTIGNWIVGNLTDTNGTGFGGYFLGYPDGGNPKELQLSKSTENNADIFAAFTRLSTIERRLGNDADADLWAARAAIAGDFVTNMFDSVAGRFYAGTVTNGTPPGPGLDPSGPVLGNDVINVADFLDANTFPVLAMADSPRYHDSLDWRLPIQYLVNFAQSAAVSNGTFHGFSLVTTNAGPNGVAWEFTGQAVETMRFVDRVYNEASFETNALFYLDQLREAQFSAPFTDRRGLVASTLPNGDAVPPVDHCLSTPFQCIPERVGLAATAWAIFAERNINPLAGPIKIPGDVNGDTRVTGADSLLINQVLVGLRFTNDLIFTVMGYANGDVNRNEQVTGSDSLFINQVTVGLRSYIVTKVAPSSRTNTLSAAVSILGIGFPTNVVPVISIGPPVNLTLTDIIVINREQITAVVPPGGGLGTGTVHVISSPTNGVISFGRFINQ